MDETTRNSIDLKVSADGQHWRFLRGKLVVEWWPSSGRVVANLDYRRPRKAHDYEQAWGHVSRVLGDEVEP